MPTIAIGPLSRKFNYSRSDAFVIASLKSEATCKLVNRTPGSRRSFDIKFTLYQARPREHMSNRSASLAMSTNVPEALPGKLDIKRHSPSILYVAMPSTAHMPRRGT